MADQRWRAYHDHTWGRFLGSDSNYLNTDFAHVVNARGETWIANGLVPSWIPNARTLRDDLWRGVLVRASRAGVTACKPRVARSHFVYGLGGRRPESLRAACGGMSVRFRWLWSRHFHPSMSAATLSRGGIGIHDYSTRQ